jgi:DNA-binding MarR family transcriptional regulator
MSLQGNIESFHLPSVLQLLSGDKKTGILTIADSTRKVQVYIKQGNIVYAVGSQKEVRLGYLLRTKGIISAEELQKALLLAKERKERLGKILVEKGYISLETLRKFLQQQIRDILYDLFLWQQGDFKYVEQDLKLEEEFITELNYMEVILEGTRRVDEWSILKKNIPNQQVIFKISKNVEEQKDSVNLTANEWRVISMVDGKRTVKQIIADSGQDEFVVYRMLNALISSGLIDKSDSATAAPRAQAQHGAQIIIQIYHWVLQGMLNLLGKSAGQTAVKLMEEAKAEVPVQLSGLLQTYDFTKDGKTNAREILKGAADPPPSDEALLNAFNTWIYAILHKQKGVMNETDMAASLQALTTPDAGWKKQLADSELKEKIVGSINQTVEQFQKELTEAPDSKDKGGGILSFLKRK